MHLNPNPNAKLKGRVLLPLPSRHSQLQIGDDDGSMGWERDGLDDAYDEYEIIIRATMMIKNSSTTPNQL